MAAVEAVILDWGGVLALPPEPADSARMRAMIADCGEREFWEVYWRYRLSYDRGEVDARTYWETVGAGLGAVLDGAQVADLVKLDIAMWSRPNPALISWTRTLYDAGIRLALLSNAHRDHAAYLRSYVDLPRFSAITVSSEVGFSKPQAEIYRHCLRTLGIKPGAALFIDDHEPNVIGAAQVGIKALLFTSAPSLAASLAELFPAALLAPLCESTAG